MKSPSALRGFVGFLCSWNGMFFAGLAKYKNTNRDACKEARNDIKRIKPLLQKQNVKFKCMSYDKHTPNNKLVYCDPPYKNTIGYSGVSGKTFDHTLFWNTIREWSKNNVVLISEETAPKDFKVIWNTKYSRGRGFKTKKKSSHKGKDVIEKLFIHKDNYKKCNDLIKKSNKINKRTKRTIKRRIY